MNRLSGMLSLLRSRVLTVWLAGAFILFYLTVAVWSKEAFVVTIAGLAKNPAAEALYVLFFLNVLFRTTARVKDLWRTRALLALRAPLYAGLVLFLCTFFLSLHVRQQAWRLLGEGDPVDVPWEGTPYRVVSVRPALEEKAFRTEGSAIFDYEPELTIVDRKGRQHRVGAFPPVMAGSNYLHVMNFGIGPAIEFKRGGETISKGYMALRLTPFGSVDSFKLDSYTVYLSILPTKVVTRGAESAREYDLKRPLYHVEIRQGDKEIARGETDSMLRFGDRMTLGFDRPSDWVLLEIVRDPVYPAYVVSLVLLVAGAILYPFSFLVRRTAAGPHALPQDPAVPSSL